MQEAFGVCEMNFMVVGADFWGFGSCGRFSKIVPSWGLAWLGTVRDKERSSVAVV